MKQGNHGITSQAPPEKTAVRFFDHFFQQQPSPQEAFSLPFIQTWII
jgi:hypothetical protein